MKPVLPIPESAEELPEDSPSLTLGRRVRHFRTQAGLTLRELAERAGTTPSHLSLIENGHREPRLALLKDLAEVLDVDVGILLTAEPPPDRRAELEIELQRAQRSPHYRSLGVAPVRPNRSTPIEVLESLVALHREVIRKARESATTPQEARRANTALRMLMRERDNYLPEIEELGEEAARAGGDASGALTHATEAEMARHVGGEIAHHPDRPQPTRTGTDAEGATAPRRGTTRPLPRPPAFRPDRDRSGERTDLSPPCLYSRRARSAFARPASNWAQTSRPHRADLLCGLPSAAVGDHLLRRDVPDPAFCGAGAPGGAEKNSRYCDRGFPGHVRRHPRGGGAAVHEPRHR